MSTEQTQYRGSSKAESLIHPRIGSEGVIDLVFWEGSTYKFAAFVDPPPPFCADVICGSPLSGTNLNIFPHRSQIRRAQGRVDLRTLQDASSHNLAMERLRAHLGKVICGYRDTFPTG